MGLRRRGRNGRSFGLLACGGSERLLKSRKTPAAIECKWSANGFDSANLQAFRRQYPDGTNVLVASDIDRSYSRTVGGLLVRFEGLQSVIKTMNAL